MAMLCRKCQCEEMGQWCWKVYSSGWGEEKVNEYVVTWVEEIR